MKRDYIALGGILASLHLVFLIISKVLVGSELLLVIFLPLISSLYILKSDNKSTFIFAISTFLLCLIFDPINTFIYIVPSLLVGITYGILRKKNIKELSLVYITTSVHVLSLIITLLSFNFLFIEFNLIQLINQTFNTSNEDNYIVLAVILIILAFIQSFLTHIISDKELDRFNFKLDKENKTPKWFIFALLFSLFGFIVTLFLCNSITPIFMLFIIIFTIPYIVEGSLNFKYKEITLFSIGFLIFVSIYIVGFINLIYLPLLLLGVISPLIINK